MLISVAAEFAMQVATPTFWTNKSLNVFIFCRKYHLCVGQRFRNHWIRIFSDVPFTLVSLFVKKPTSASPLTDHTLVTTLPIAKYIYFRNPFGCGALNTEEDDRRMQWHPRVPGHLESCDCFSSPLGTQRKILLRPIGCRRFLVTSSCLNHFLLLLWTKRTPLKSLYLTRVFYSCCIKTRQSCKSANQKNCGLLILEPKSSGYENAATFLLVSSYSLYRRSAHTCYTLVPMTITRKDAFSMPSSNPLSFLRPLYDIAVWQFILMYGVKRDKNIIFTWGMHQVVVNFICKLVKMPAFEQSKASDGKLEYWRQGNQRNGTVVPRSMAKKYILLSWDFLETT